MNKMYKDMAQFGYQFRLIHHWAIVTRLFI